MLQEVSKSTHSRNRSARGGSRTVASAVTAPAPTSYGLPPLGGWYPAVTNANAAGMLSSYVLVLGSNGGVLYKAGFPPQSVTIVGTQPGGPTGTRVRVSAGAFVSPTKYPQGWPTESIGPFQEALAPFSQGSSVVASSGGARVGNPVLPAPQIRMPVRYAPGDPGLVDPTWANLPWVYIAWVGPEQDLDSVENQANIMGIDRYVVLDPLEWVMPGQPAPQTTGWMYVTGSASPPKHVRQVASKALTGVQGAPFFSKGKFVDIASVVQGLGVAVPNPSGAANCPDDPLLDMSSLTLRSQNPALDGVAVTDVEPIDGASEQATEGDVMVVTFVDPTDGREKIAAVMVMDADDGEPWWKHDGHCCEDCALGKDKPCDGGSCGVADSAVVSNPAPRYGVFAR